MQKLTKKRNLIKVLIYIESFVTVNKRLTSIGYINLSNEKIGIYKLSSKNDESYTFCFIL